MSNKPNHRRGHDRIQDNGPTYESRTPCAGCNSTHVARSRAKWKARNNRYRRRHDRLLVLEDGVLPSPQDHPNYRRK